MTMNSITMPLSEQHLSEAPEVILDQELMLLGFRYLTFFNGQYIYFTKSNQFELNRVDGMTGSHFVIYKNADKVFDGNITSLAFLQNLLLNLGAIQETKID